MYYLLFNLEVIALKIEEIPEMKLLNQPYFDEQRWVSPLNFMSEALYDKFPEKVKIHDVTLRDGEQTCGLVWREDERVRIALALDELGVSSIEVGMPIVSEENLRAIKKLASMNLKSEIVAFARCLKKDLDASLESEADRVIVEHAVNPYLNKYVYKVTKEELIDRVIKSISYLKDRGMRVTFMGWDTTRSSVDYLLDVFETVARESEPESVVFVDSFGVATPFAINFIFRKLREKIPQPVELEFHVHNEFGLAMGSVIAAVAGGARVIHSSMNGLGERTGNVATEQVAAAFQLLLNIDTGVRLEKLWYVSKLVQDIAKLSPGYNAPVVGERLFWVESGIVVDAMKKLNASGINPAMTPYMPSLVGREGPIVKLGAFSGKASVELFLEMHGISASPDDIEKITEIIRREGRIRKAVLDENEVMRIVKEVLG